MVSHFVHLHWYSVAFSIFKLWYSPKLPTFILFHTYIYKTAVVYAILEHNGLYISFLYFIDIIHHVCLVNKYAHVSHLFVFRSGQEKFPHFWHWDIWLVAKKPWNIWINVHIKAINSWNKYCNKTTKTTQKKNMCICRAFPWCQLCRRWWHRKSSSSHPAMSPVTTKLASSRLSVFSVSMIYGIYCIS